MSRNAHEAEEKHTLLSSEDKTTVDHDLFDTEDTQKTPLMETILTLLYCLGYLVVGPVLILTNKHILKDIGFGYPMLVSGIGQALCPANVFGQPPVSVDLWLFVIRHHLH